MIVWVKPLYLYDDPIANLRPNVFPDCYGGPPYIPVPTHWEGNSIVLDETATNEEKELWKRALENHP